MIENTWKWARDNGKIIKHPISGGEFVDIDVEHLLRKTNETGSRFTQGAGTHYEAWKQFKYPHGSLREESQTDKEKTICKAEADRYYIFKK